MPSLHETKWVYGFWRSGIQVRRERLQWAVEVNHNLEDGVCGEAIRDVSRKTSSYESSSSSSSDSNSGNAPGMDGGGWCVSFSVMPSWDSRESSISQRS
jgi:hypothetical protein